MQQCPGRVQLNELGQVQTAHAERTTARIVCNFDQTRALPTSRCRLGQIQSERQNPLLLLRNDLRLLAHDFK